MGKRRNLWRGLTTCTASLLTISLAAGPLVDNYRTDIDKFLGTKSSAMVTDNTEDEDLYTYASDYSSTTELLDSIEDLGERMSEEGTVLLKNENSALPLTKEETQKVSLLGFSSYYPVQGGDMGSSLNVNQGTDADTVDFVQALDAKGFKINEDIASMYKSLEAEFKTEVCGEILLNITTLQLLQRMVYFPARNHLRKNWIVLTVNGRAVWMIIM